MKLSTCYQRATAGMGAATQFQSVIPRELVTLAPHCKYKQMSDEEEDYMSDKFLAGYGLFSTALVTI